MLRYATIPRHLLHALASGWPNNDHLLMQKLGFNPIMYFLYF